MTAEPLLDVMAVKRAFERHIGGGWKTTRFGDIGFTLWHSPSRYSIVVSADDEPFDGVMWIHASIANQAICEIGKVLDQWTDGAYAAHRREARTNGNG